MSPHSETTHHSHPATPTVNSGSVTVCASVAALTLIVAVAGSWNVSLWTDEAATISAATRSLGELWAMVHNIDVVHGAYYLFMHFWTNAFGISPFALRLPSALAMAAAAAGVYRLALVIAGARAAAVSGVVFALLPRATWLGMEARPYAFTAAAAVWATVALLSALRRPSIGRWAIYVVLVTVGIGLNIYVALLLGGHAISVILDRRNGWPQRRMFVGAGFVAVVLASPLVLMASKQTGQLGDSEVTPSLVLRNAVVNQWFLGDTPTTTTGGSVNPLAAGDPLSWWLPAAIALAALCWLLVAAAGLRTVRSPGDLDAETRRGAVETLRWMLPWLALPTLVIGLYSILVKPMYSPRYLSFGTPAMAIIIGVGLLMVARRRVRTTAAVVIVALVIPIYLSQRQPYAKNSSDWVDAAGFVAANRGAADAVYFSPRYPVTGSIVGQTTRGIGTAYPQDFLGMHDVTLETSAVAAANLTGFSRLLADSVDQLVGVGTVWVIRRHDYSPASAQRDDDLLGEAGFHPSLQWSGPLSIVIQFVRQ